MGKVLILCYNKGKMTNFLHGGKGETKMKRDPGVEFMRILACLMVIGIHTALYAQVDGSWIFSRVFLTVLLRME